MRGDPTSFSRILRDGDDSSYYFGRGNREFSRIMKRSPDDEDDVKLDIRGGGNLGFSRILRDSTFSRILRDPSFSRILRQDASLSRIM